MKRIKSLAFHNPRPWEKFVALLGLSPRGTPLMIRAVTAQALPSASKASASTSGKPERDAPRARVVATATACTARKKDITRQSARTTLRKDPARSFAHLLESEVGEGSLPSRVEGWSNRARDGRPLK